MRVIFCETCGAPIDARWSEIVLVCRYCGTQNAPGGPAEPVPSSLPDDERPRLAVAGRTYAVEGLLAKGDSSNVYRGRWVRRLGELVVLKVLRSRRDADLLHREFTVLERLHKSDAQGAEHFVRRLPQPIGIGASRDAPDGRPVAVYGWQSGYVHTLEEIVREHPNGVEGEAAVWLFKRQLELLGFAHRAGFLHGAVLPPHVLVHPRDHGAILVGWSAATELSRGERLSAVSRNWRPFYPREVLANGGVGPATDIAMAARSVLASAGAKGFDRAPSLPAKLARLLVDAAGGRYDDAWALLDGVEQVSRSCFGAPSYHPIRMPKWSIAPP